jgi:Zn finger protein HypA/HybF involved in hydrogenase expression
MTIINRPGIGILTVEHRPLALPPCPPSVHDSAVVRGEVPSLIYRTVQCACTRCGRRLSKERLGMKLCRHCAK